MLACTGSSVTKKLAETYRVQRIANMRCTNAGVSYAAQITPCYPTHSTADAQHVKRLHLITPAVLLLLFQLQP
jgi:hypothetical protein